jgi:hypothetical protein
MACLYEVNNIVRSGSFYVQYFFLFSIRAYVCARARVCVHEYYTKNNNSGNNSDISPRGSRFQLKYTLSRLIRVLANTFHI